MAARRPKDIGTAAETAALRDTLSIRVFGTPAPQGSKRARPIYRGKAGEREFTGKVAQQESSKKVAPWRTDVKTPTEAALPADWQPISEPVAASVVFIFTRPKSHYGTGRNADMLKKSAPARPTGKTVHGDVEKLLRSTFDALTAAGVWTDDCLVTDVSALKFFGARPGARIHIRPADYMPPWIGDEPEKRDAFTLTRHADYGNPL